MSFMSRIFSVLIFFATLTGLAFPCTSAHAAAYADLSPDFRKTWEALLHYSSEISLIDPGSTFFLSRNGWHDPAAELLATIDYLQKNPDGMCSYPARFYLIYGHQPDKNKCTEFLEYSKHINMENLSVVFASEDETSPVSSMGHVFLMTGGRDANGIYKRHSLGFVADSSSSSLLMQFLTDSIEGRYTLAPYDNTVHQYISEEHRSLWEYSINLDPEARLILFLHMFELKTHKIRYSFFNHNCASGLNRILAAADPELDFGKTGWYITPVEYIKHIKGSGRIENITLRPSSTDKYYMKEELPVDPAEAPPASRLTLGYQYSSLNRNSLTADFMLLYSDLNEDLWYTSKTNEFQFFKISGIVNSSGAHFSEIKILELRSLPNLLAEDFKINFGIELHGNINSEHTQLYPDIHAGTGFSLFASGFIPFAEISSGVHINHGGLNPYITGEAGFMIKTLNMGKLTFSTGFPVSRTGEYRGYKNETALIYSKRISSSLWLRLDGKYFRTRKGKNICSISSGFSYRF